MSDDTYTFEFRPLDVRPKVQSYLEFSGEDIESFSLDEVVLFSGGIDSFAGAVERLAADGKSVALVSHRSATKIASTQTELVASLRARFGRSRILHIPVLVNLDEHLGREFDAPDPILSICFPGCGHRAAVRPRSRQLL